MLLVIVGMKNISFLQHKEFLVRTGWCPCLTNMWQYLTIFENRVMSLLDQNFSNQCKPVINSLERLPDIINGALSQHFLLDWDTIVPGEGDMTMMFSESSLVRNIFSKMSEISVIYTVQILPRTDKACIMATFWSYHPIHMFVSGFSGSGGFRRGPWENHCNCDELLSQQVLHSPPSLGLN